MPGGGDTCPYSQYWCQHVPKSKFKGPPMVDRETLFREKQNNKNKQRAYTNRLDQDSFFIQLLILALSLNSSKYF